MRRIPTVVVSGHLVDGPDRSKPRFPADQVGRVAAEMRRAFDGWEVGPGWTIVTGGARGVDVMAAEEALERGGEVRLCLALPPEQFEDRSVALPGTDWSQRFRRLLERAHVEVVTGGDAEGVEPFVRANQRIVEVAQQLTDLPHALLVWNGQRAEGPGGTSDLITRLHLNGPGPRVRVIDPTRRQYERRQYLCGPKKLLALDGGGIRGVLTLSILGAIEEQLRRHYGRELVLGDYFDYIGGTSTGAIIAAGLASGSDVATLRSLYQALGRSVFTKRHLPQQYRSRYRDGPLSRELMRFFGPACSLGDPNLRSLLLVVLHNSTTDSMWPLSNCTQAAYNRADRYLSTPPDRNLDLPLATVLRGSTAAPLFFPPQQLRVGTNSFVFEDGGVTAFNNPALLMFTVATLPEYALGWPAGEQEMLIVSVGTGSSASVHPGLLARSVGLTFQARNLPTVFINGSSVAQDMLCRAFGRCRFGDQIDSEIGRLVGGRRLFTYARYNADLSDSALTAKGIRDAGTRRRLRKLDAVEAVPFLEWLGREVGAGIDVNADFAGFLEASLAHAAVR